MMRLNRARLRDDADTELTPTIRRLQQRYDRERRQPDAAFVQSLEKQLFAGPTPSVTTGAVQRIRPDLEKNTLFGPRHAVSSMTVAFSLVLLFAMIGSLVFVIARGYGPEDEDPDQSAGLTVAGASPTSLPAVPGIEWQVPIEGELIRFGGIALANQTLYRMYESSDFDGVESIDTLIGEVRWRTEIEWTTNTIAVGSSAIYVARATDDGSTKHELVALDPENGSTLREFALPAEALFVIFASSDASNSNGSVQGSDQYLIVQTTDDMLVAFDPELGTPLWSMSLRSPDATSAGQPGAVHSVSPPAISRNQIVALSSDGNLSGRFLSDGIEVWHKPGLDTALLRFTVSNFVAVIVETIQPPGTQTVMRATGISMENGAGLWQRDLDGALAQPVATVMYSAQYIVAFPVSVDVQRVATPASGAAAGSPIATTQTQLFAIEALEPATGEILSITSGMDSKITYLTTRFTGPTPGAFFAVLENRTMFLVFFGATEMTRTKIYPAPGVYDGNSFTLEQPLVVAPVGSGAGMFAALADGAVISLDDSRVLSTHPVIGEL